MEKSDLYKLPKDMLVKLLATIREDTIKEMEAKTLDISHIQRFNDSEKCIKYLKYIINTPSVLIRNAKNCDYGPGELRVIPQSNNEYKEIDSGFILKQEDNGTVIAMGIENDDGIRRELSEDEKVMARSMGLVVQ